MGEYGKNRQLLIESMAEWTRNRDDLIHGSLPYIPHTSHYCTLQQMKIVDDQWIPFKSLLEEGVLNKPQENISNDDLLALDKMQWNAGIDPMFNAMTIAVNR